MELNLKKQIIGALQQYASTNNLSQEQLAQKSGLSTAYINSLLQGNITHKASKDKDVQISDKSFRMLATAIGFQIEKTYWQTRETTQYLSAKAALVGAKMSGRTAMILGVTGCGKSYTVDDFCVKFPINTLRITVSSLYNLSDVINELCELLKISIKGSKASRLSKVAAKFRDIKNKGGKPILIIDEGENMTVPVLKMLKGLYDAVKNYCAIVLVGTPELLENLEKLRDRGKVGMPQLYRRFKAGICNLPDIKQKDIENNFLKEINDKELRRLLLDSVDNYGELNDYLEPALREADRLGEELTEELFRMIYGMERKAA